MGFIINYATCSCGGVRVNERNYHTSEESDFCLKCGSFIKTVQCVNKEGVLSPFYEIKKGGGYGAARLAFKDSWAASFHYFNSKEEVLYFKEGLQLKREADKDKSDLELDLDNTYVFSYNPETSTGEVIYGFGKPEEACEHNESVDDETRVPEVFIPDGSEKGNREDLEFVEILNEQEIIVKQYAVEVEACREFFDSRETLLKTYPEASVIEGYTFFDATKSIFPNGRRFFFETIEEAKANRLELPF